MSQRTKRTSKIYLAGHNGMVGSAIERRLRKAGYTNIATRTKQQLDLTQQQHVESWFQGKQFDLVILAAARVGGIYANSTYPAEFIFQNLMIQSNVIHSAYRNNVERLIFLGSSCIYPRDCPQPMREEYLLTGALESTNAPYAVAKIAGVATCEAYNKQYNTGYMSLMPTNLYGSHDNFDLHTSHVIPAMIRKIHEAKTEARTSVVLWGSGSPFREFLHVDDLADACVFLVDQDPKYGIFNVGSGQELRIRELASLIAEIVNYPGEIVFDASMPDGTPRKLLDSSRIYSLGWRPRMSLRQGIEQTYDWFLRHWSEAA